MCQACITTSNYITTEEERGRRRRGPGPSPASCGTESPEGAAITLTVLEGACWRAWATGRRGAFRHRLLSFRRPLTCVSPVPSRSSKGSTLPRRGGKKAPEVSGKGEESGRGPDGQVQLEDLERNQKILQWMMDGDRQRKSSHGWVRFTRRCRHGNHPVRSRGEGFTCSSALAFQRQHQQLQTDDSQQRVPAPHLGGAPRGRAPLGLRPAAQQPLLGVARPTRLVVSPGPALAPLHPGSRDAPQPSAEPPHPAGGG